MEKRKQLLVRALQDSDENIRTLAAESLERLEIRGRLAFLEKVFETGDKMAKLRAVYALSNLRGAQVVSILLKASKDEIEDVRAAAVRVIGSIADKEVLPELIERLNDPSSIVERVVIDAISAYREPQTIVPLMQLLKTSKDPGVIERVLDAIGRTGDKRAEEAMSYFAVKGNFNMRCISLRSLGYMEV
ncbi:MAG TPA: HEAT repeat domain-containing protein [Thermodesulfobacteriota bacterium]|nr:HEAT repeat domain-containing protein [Thermodesulfobacteriota bacterium]